MKNNNICPVCGYKELNEPPYDQYGYPSYEICPCCGFEYGYDDSSKKYTFERYREKWIDNGFKFFRKKEEPKIWDREAVNEQLKNISNVDHKPRL